MKVKGGFFPGVTVVIALVVAAGACGRNTAPQTSTPPAGTTPAAPAASPVQRVNFNDIMLPQARLTITREGGSTPTEILRLSVKLAEDSGARSKGLMGVPSLPATAGMVFRYNFPVENAFHMQNTLIPLDIAFWGEDGKIHEIMQMSPCKESPCRRYQPKQPFIAALEVRGGLLKEKNVRVGDTVTLTAQTTGG